MSEWLEDEEVVEIEEDLDESIAEDSEVKFNPKQKYTKKELEEMADVLLRQDADRELCRTCLGTDPDWLPYGEETGEVEWQIQKDKEGAPLFDDQGQTLYVAFPELRCEKGHRWYKGEGPRRDIRGKDVRGKDPILFETHLYNRKRREIHVKDGIPDPAFTMDRWGKRPTVGIYNRSHPQGRKINTEEQRKKKTGPVGTGREVICRCAVLLLLLWEEEPLPKNSVKRSRIVWRRANQQVS